MMEQAFARVSEALEDGELVCIFPEGSITETGQMSVFRPGIMQVLQRNPVPVVPLALRGLWGSFFSRAHGRAMSRLLPRGLLSRIELVAGDPVDGREARLQELQQRVTELRGDRL